MKRVTDTIEVLGTLETPEGSCEVCASADLTEQMGTFALVPQVAREVKVPVIAAGGITDSRGAAAAMALGAAGVQIATAYMLDRTVRSEGRAAARRGKNEVLLIPCPIGSNYS